MEKLQDKEVADYGNAEDQKKAVERRVSSMRKGRGSRPASDAQMSRTSTGQRARVQSPTNGPILSGNSRSISLNHNSTKSGIE